MSPRRGIGRDFSFSERTYVFLADGAVELDKVDGYSVTRRRVLLDEVLLVTLHRARRPEVLIMAGLLCAMFAWPLLALKVGWGEVVLFTTLASPFALAFLVHLIFGIDYVTVFGRRGKARMAFSFRKGRAREVYRLIIAEVRAAQDARRPAAPPENEPAEAMGDR